MLALVSLLVIGDIRRICRRCSSFWPGSPSPKVAPLRAQVLLRGWGEGRFWYDLFRLALNPFPEPARAIRATPVR